MGGFFESRPTTHYLCEVPLALRLALDCCVLGANGVQGARMGGVDLGQQRAANGEPSQVANSRRGGLLPFLLPIHTHLFTIRPNSNWTKNNARPKCVFTEAKLVAKKKGSKKQKKKKGGGAGAPSQWPSNYALLRPT